MEGLPALEAVDYVSRDNWLGVALAALMRIPKERKAWLRTEAERRIMESKENHNRKYLLHECVVAYLPLDEHQQREYQDLMTRDPYQEVPAMVASLWEKKELEGIEKGIEKGKREMLQKCCKCSWKPASVR